MKRGTTLLELLVAISLLGLVSLGLLFSLRIGLSAWQRGNSRMTSNRKVLAAADLFAAQVANVEPRRVEWGPKDRRVAFLYFDGARDHLRFLTHTSVVSRSRGGLWLAEYSFHTSLDGTCSLEYNEWPFRQDRDVAFTVGDAGPDPAKGRLVVQFTPPARRPETRQLYTGLEKCGFEYLIEPPSAEAHWGPEWDDASPRLPRAVAARFRTREPRGVEPMALVATLVSRESR